jgi:hypothetical protein
MAPGLTGHREPPDDERASTGRHHMLKACARRLRPENSLPSGVDPNILGSVVKP